MSKVIAGLLVALGIAFAGWQVNQGIIIAKQPIRVITAKGMAERDVKADLALWQIIFVRTGDELSVARDKINQDDEIVNQFLSKNQLSGNSISFKTLDLTDRDAKDYNSGQSSPRYIIKRVIMIRSNDVDRVASAYQNSDELVNEGVILVKGNDYDDNGTPVYLFNGLNAIKADMIKEATHNAKIVAEQFAADSSSQLGKIQSAEQGVFQILPRDKAPMLKEEKQIDKTVRIVSTIRYQIN